MTSDEPESSPAPLPRERACRVVEDADARGIPVVLQGGEVWYVLPLPLSPRGMRIAELMDAIEDLEVELGAAERRISLARRALDEAATPDAIEEAKGRVLATVSGRRATAERMAAHYRDLGYHALRSMYRVTPPEADALVTQRHFPDVVAALNGRDTERSQQEMAIALFERLQRAAGKGIDGTSPLGSPTGSAGPAGSSSPAAATPTA